MGKEYFDFDEKQRANSKNFAVPIGDIYRREFKNSRQTCHNPGFVGVLLRESLMKNYRRRAAGFYFLLLSVSFFVIHSTAKAGTPVAMIYHERLIFLKMRINERHEALFLLDTGASASAIDRKTAEKLKLLINGSDKVEGTAGVIEVGKTMVKSLSLNNAKVNALTVPTYDLSGVLAPPGMALDGILGFDFLKHFMVRIDYESETIEFLSSRRKNDETLLAVPIALDNGIPKLSVVLDDSIPTDLRLDTGASLFQTPDIYLNITERVWNELTNLDSALKPEKYFTGSGVGGTVKLPVSRIKKMAVGELVFGAPFVIVQPKAGYFARNDAVGFISNNFLEKFGAVILDYPARTLYLKRITSGAR